MLLVDALLPVRCAACGAPAPAGMCRWCERSAGALLLGDRGWEVLGDGVAAVGRYAYDGVVRDAVHGLKLRGRYAAARPLGGALRAHVALPTWPVTWVPSTRRTLRRRGFEVPRLLAGPDAAALLERVGRDPDQTSLSAAERRSAPAGSFRPVADPPPRVLLVDDVRTTGATARAAAGALRDAGAERVLVVTFAVGGDAARRDTPAADRRWRS